MTMVNSEEFAKRLEKILDYYGLSATAFSEQIDFNRSTISHLLSGRNKPSLDFVMKVLDEFPEVELFWLLNGKGHFPSDETAVQNSNSELPAGYWDSCLCTFQTSAWLPEACVAAYISRPGWHNTPTAFAG